jgi:hypothetical protein
MVRGYWCHSPRFLLASISEAHDFSSGLFLASTHFAFCQYKMIAPHP